MSNKHGYVHGLHDNYQIEKDAHVNFYHWSVYNLKKKYKSYGLQGETEFYIGKGFHDVVTNELQLYFTGNFPEFISFPFELSENQKNRVASYLALKYGLTLPKTDYRNSKNLIFWKKENDAFFGHRIFGLGRDDRSNLNQLVSQSMHLQKYLVAYVKKYVPLDKANNPLQQTLASIPDNHFIVFGDNGKAPKLNERPNGNDVRTLKRIWLSQNTGDEAAKIPVFLLFDIQGQILDILNDPHNNLRLWMLRDPYATNQAESEFDSEYVIYTQANNIEYQDNGTIHFTEAEDRGLFGEIHFDEDKNVFDQYTFGIGPELIVQVHPHRDCNSEKFKTEIVITGGRPKYKELFINN